VGSYVKVFEVPANMEGRPVFISFQGVEAACYVWLNGHFVGYSEDSFTPAEFELTPYLLEGANKLAVEVYQRCTGSWLEDQDFWRFSGIFREVYLYTVPELHVQDLRISTGLAIISANVLLLFLFGRALLGFFTADPEIVAIGVSLLALNLILQPCKMLNMAMGNSLNAIGDTRYTMVVSMISMSLIGVGGSYWLGIQAGWGLVGIYCCMIADEAARGVLVLLRWRKRKVLRQAEARFAGHQQELREKPGKALPIEV
jgi:hypothetical protein